MDDEGPVGETTERVLLLPNITPTGDSCWVQRETDFTLALQRLEEREFDLVVLDVRIKRPGTSDLLPGIDVFHSIRDRQFIPVIFYTALPEEAAGLENAPFTSVVSKGDEPTGDDEDPLRAAVRAVIESGLPRIARAVRTHAQRVERELLGRVVETNWTEVSAAERLPEVGHLLARALARSLDDDSGGLQALLGGPEVSGKGVNPLRYYSFDSVSRYATGDLLRPTGAGQPAAATDPASPAVAPTDSGDRWWIILTPSCDFVDEGSQGRRADYVVLAACLHLRDHKYFRDYVSELKKEPPEKKLLEKATNRLTELVRDNAGPKDRYRFLPKAWSVPDLVVDLQQLASVAFDDLKKFDRVARLDAPYAQSLAAQMVSYLGRAGAPDLDKPAHVDRVLALAADS